MEKFFQKLAKNKFLRAIGLTQQQSFQFIDSYRASLALKGYKHYQNNGGKAITVEDLDLMHSELSKLNEGQIRALVQSQITEQMIDLFNNIHEIEVYNRVVPKVTRDGSIKKEAPKPWQFTLEAKPSLMPNAGEGVFVRTLEPLHPGTVVALYP
eukprot:gene37040-44954_t